MGRLPRNINSENSELKKGPWTPEEDQRLIDYIQKHGQRNWKLLSEKAGLNRCGKSCRLRWTNYLRPDIKRGNFTVEEEQTIIDLHSVLGNKWSTIAANLPGRTDNEIKNFWNTHLKKKLMLSGIDPQTHQPIPDYFLNPPDPMHYSSHFNNLLIMKTPLEVLAKVQLLCNILQILDANPVPDFIREPAQNVNQYHHGISNHAQVSSTVPTLENGNQVFSNFGPILNTSTTIPEFRDTNYEYSLPAATPEISSGLIENYEQILGTCGIDDEANSFWKEIFIKSSYPHCSF